MASNLAPSFGVIVYAPEVVAVRHRREGAVQRENFQTMPRQIKLTNDLRPQQRHDVGTDGKLETGKELFGNRRAAHHIERRTAFRTERTTTMRSIAAITAMAAFVRPPTLTPDAAASQITDGLTADVNDLTAMGTENYLLGFPYLGTPHSGFSVGTV